MLEIQNHVLDKNKKGAGVGYGGIGTDEGCNISLSTIQSPKSAHSKNLLGSTV